METYEFILIAVVLGVVAVDAIVRFRVAPGRRNRFVKQLLSVFVATENDSATEDATPETRSLADSLLKHFRQSFGSRHIVQILSEAPGGMTEKELEQRFSELATRSGKSSLPSNALRKVMLILMGASFVKLSDGKFQMTELGWALHSMLGSGSDRREEFRLKGRFG